MGKQDEKERWPGFPERLREAFQRAGYWKNDRPDIMRFGLQHGIHVSYLYKYVGGDAVPDRERLVLLGTALGVRAGWLLLGEEEPRVPKAVRRQGRRTAGSLVLALGLASASVFGWPLSSGGARAEAQPVRHIIRRDELSSRFYWLNAVCLIGRRVAAWWGTCTLSPMAA